jgi:23S rRNA U2552 (ribose-2'-O)-methylase RlmE/FtsJ
MLYFIIPHNYKPLYKFIKLVSCSNDATSSSSTGGEPIISQSLNGYLTNIKQKMDLCQTQWDDYKKVTNPYEYITTPISAKTTAICLYKPLSRSYFKMIELIHLFRIVEPFKQMIDQPNPIRSFHLAEGPGGFIEALVHCRNKNPKDMYVGMTLQNPNDHNVPAWTKSQHFLRAHVNVFIENGLDQTGNLLSVDNFSYCKAKYGSSMDFITGDGGFDFSENYNKQELNIGPLLFAQIAYAVCLQKHNGSFILKIFDTFMKHTIDMIYLLSSFYEYVYITKPDTSRYANSEKYLVCIGFRYTSYVEFEPFINNAFEDVVSSNMPIQSLLTKPHPYYFVVKIEEYNTIFGQQQVENILHTLQLIETANARNAGGRINEYIKGNVNKCINWCIRHNIPYKAIGT